MANRITKKDNFTAIISVLNEAGYPDLAEVMTHELELLERKNANRSNAPTATQRENAEIKADLLNKMEPDVWYKCSELKAMNATLSAGNGTQRTAALLNQLHAEGKVDKVIEKRVVYFKLA